MLRVREHLGHGSVLLLLVDLSGLLGSRQVLAVRISKKRGEEGDLEERDLPRKVVSSLLIVKRRGPLYASYFSFTLLKCQCELAGNCLAEGGTFVQHSKPSNNVVPNLKPFPKLSNKSKGDKLELLRMAWLHDLLSTVFFPTLLVRSQSWNTK